MDNSLFIDRVVTDGETPDPKLPVPSDDALAGADAALGWASGASRQRSAQDEGS